MKLKQLKMELTRVKSFDNPKILLEQYITPHDIAAALIYTAHFEYNDIEDKKILDLCSGTGMLSVAASFFNPAHITCLECDLDSINTCKENFTFFEIENYEIVHERFEDNVFMDKFDTVIMNPPFGTRCRGVDTAAVDFALDVGNVVYSLHKRSTRDYLLEKYKNSKVIAEVEYDIKRSYKFHKKNVKPIEVDLIRFVKE
ncbi:Methyltransferase-like protein 5 [Conglomerata obtusa]